MGRILFRFHLIALMATLLGFVASEVDAGIQLPAGKELQVAFVADVSSKFVKPSQLVEIRLVEAIDVGGIVVVEKGAMGSARIKSVEAAGKGGKPGRLEVELVELEPKGDYKAEGDEKIALKAITDDESGTIRVKGKSRKTLSYLLIFGLFFKGTEAVIPADQPYKAVVAEDITLVQ